MAGDNDKVVMNCKRASHKEIALGDRDTSEPRCALRPTARMPAAPGQQKSSILVRVSNCQRATNASQSHIGHAFLLPPAPWPPSCHTRPSAQISS